MVPSIASSTSSSSSSFSSASPMPCVVDPLQKGATALIIGQDLFSIDEYVQSQYNASLHRGSIEPRTSFHPAGTMFYTDLQTLRGLETPVDYGSGVEYAPGLGEAFPQSALQIGLWLNGTAGCHDILEGALDENLHRLFDSLDQLVTTTTTTATTTTTGRASKVYLRVGYEFDNPSFGYSDDPSAYQQAFRRMVHACEYQLGHGPCHHKIAFCWHSWAAPKVVASLDVFYPGDDVVDWVGISVFQQVYPWANQNDDDDDDVSSQFAGGTRAQVVEVLEFARAHNKPMMIAESTPFGGIYLKKDDHSTFVVPPDKARPSSVLDEDDDDGSIIWNLWFQPVLELIEEYDIAMWSYINCDWNAQPMWHNIGFGDTRLSSSSTVMDRWHQHVLQNPRFVGGALWDDCQDINNSANHQHPDHQHQHWGGSLGASLTSATMVVPKWSTNDIKGSLLPKVVVMSFLAILVYILRCNRTVRIVKVKEQRDNTRNQKDNESRPELSNVPHNDYGSITIREGRN